MTQRRPAAGAPALGGEPARGGGAIASPPLSDSIARDESAHAEHAAGDAAWEAAYRRFETPEEEVRKFERRLGWFGAERWSRDLRIVELFCGRGNGLVALERLGFNDLTGVDLSPALLEEYAGSGRRVLADCRAMPFEESSKDVAIVQGGLHHLGRLPEDLDEVLAEVRRILAPQGLLMVVEPWMTPFLALAHLGCRSSLARRLWPRLDALATMTEHERPTYERWLRSSKLVLPRLRRAFVPMRSRIAWGKLFYLGRVQFDR